MIDWQVQIDGCDPTGWDQHRDGCWFPDFAHQEYLLPLFDVGTQSIDPYGDTEFNDADLRRLQQRLASLRSTVERKPAKWPLTESSATRNTVVHLDRQKILAVVDKTLRMIEYALANGGKFVFRGD